MILTIVTFLLHAHTAPAKTFQNSYIAFEVPDNWTCLQEGVAWTCTSKDPTESREAVIVLAAKVAGPEDNLNSFLSFLRQPKKITTRVGTPMPSQVMYAQERVLAKHNWVQSQHLGSEIQEFYTLYLATVKDQLAILITFSAERTRYAKYNPIFAKAMSTMKIVANQKLLFPKRKDGSPEILGIQPNSGLLGGDDLLPPPERLPTSKTTTYLVLLLLVAAVGALAYTLLGGRRRKKSPGKSGRPRPK